MRRFRGVRGLVVGLLALGSPTAGAQTGQFVGVDSMRLFVGGLAGEVPAGLTPDAVRGAIDTVLAGAGLAVDPREDSAAPALRMGFSIRKLPGGWVIGVRAELIELSVSLREYVWEVSRREQDASRGGREPEAVLSSLARNFTTWSRFAVATCPDEAGLDTAITVVQQLVVELAGAVRIDNLGG